MKFSMSFSIGLRVLLGVCVTAKAGHHFARRASRSYPLESRMSYVCDDDGLGPPPASAPPGGLALRGAPAQVPLIQSSNSGINGNPEPEERTWDCRFTDDVRWGKNNEGQQTLNEYVLLGELGRGSYGRVQLCERRVGKPPWRQFALKIMSKPRLRRLSEYVNTSEGGMRKITAEDKMRQEIEIMRHLFHRNVVILFEVLEENAHLDYNDPDDEGRVCLVQEYMEGGATMTCDDETGTFKRSNWRVGGSAAGGRGTGGEEVYSEDEAKPLFRDMAEGLLYLHDRGIIHRDIKPDNLLLFENGALRICDFGCARRVKGDVTSSNSTDAQVGEEGLTDSVGTYMFHPPESLRGDGTAYSGRAADAWAAACTLYCWIFGQFPFYDDALEPLFAKIREEELHLGHAVSPALASLLRGMLEKDPAQRIGLQAALEHPWMEDVPDRPAPAGFRPAGTADA